MDTLVLGLTLFVAVSGAALSLVQLAQVRALRRESRAMAETLSHLSMPPALDRASSARRLSEARRTAVRIAELPIAEAERSRSMIQLLRTIRPGEEPPEELLERPSGFWPTHQGPSNQA